MRAVGCSRSWAFSNSPQGTGVPLATHTSQSFGTGTKREAVPCPQTPASLQKMVLPVLDSLTEPPAPRHPGCSAGLAFHRGWPSPPGTHNAAMCHARACGKSG